MTWDGVRILLQKKQNVITQKIDSVTWMVIE